MTGLGLLTPVVPEIVGRFAATPDRVAWATAALATTYALAQFFSTPLLGALSDRWGRKPILMVSFLGSAVTYVVFGWAPALALLFAGRLVDGLTAANIGTSQACLADITAPPDRSRAMGLAGAALGVGFVAGPLIGFALTRAGAGVHVPVYLAAVLAVCSTVLAWRWLPETLPRDRRETDPFRRRHLNPLAPLAATVSRAALRPLAVAALLTNFAMAGLRALFAVFAAVQLQFAPAQIYGVMGFLGLMMVVAQGGLVRPAVSRWGDRGTLLVGLTISAAGFFAVSLSAATSHLYLAVGITAIGVGLSLPTMASLVSRLSASHEQGAMLGATQAAGALGQVLGPLWAGWMFDLIGPGAPFASGGLLVLGALVALRWTRYPDPR